MKKSKTPLTTVITLSWRVLLKGKDFRHASASEGTTKGCPDILAHGSAEGTASTLEVAMSPATKVSANRAGEGDMVPMLAGSEPPLELIYPGCTSYLCIATLTVIRKNHTENPEIARQEARW